MSQNLLTAASASTARLASRARALSFPPSAVSALSASVTLAPLRPLATATAAAFATAAGAPGSGARHYPSLSARPPIVTGNVYDGFASAVGNTPLIRLADASARTGCEIYGKAEFMNPGGSVKDRAGLYLVAAAEAQGILTPGQPGIIVEGTAGNTGIGLTLAANARGYRTIIVIPETQSQEKKDTLRFCGAQLIEVPAVPFSNPANYVHIAARLARALQTHPARPCPVHYANQWDSVANRAAHVEGTGPEIWAQLKGRVDAFSCAMGTGGTLAGTAAALRARNPDVVIGLTDPLGAVPATFYTTGKAVAGQGSSVAEGIGQGRITGNMGTPFPEDNAAAAAPGVFRPDRVFEVDDAAAIAELNALTLHEGLQVGLSSGINVAGAVKLARELGPGKTLVTVLCDGAMRYAGKMYNPSFLRAKGLPVPQWLDTEAKPDCNSSGTGAAATAQALLPFDLGELVKQAIAGTELSPKPPGVA